ncbi:MAG TPA: thioredoxin domain-containing protein [Chloroflexota bacterium]
MRSPFSSLLLLAMMLVGCAAPTPPPPIPTPEPTVTPAPVLEARTSDGNYYLGRADAPLTVEMFGDFQCPVCGEFARTTEPPFMTNYVETGKARFVWRDFAWIGVESFLAAQAARCAGQQGHFWGFHNYLFAHQQGENLGTFSQQNLTAIAENLGLEPNAFGACMNSGEEPKLIQQEVRFGVSLGIDVTPAFLINGDLRIGAPPSSRFPALLESYLARVPH